MAETMVGPTNQHTGSESGYEAFKRKRGNLLALIGNQLAIARDLKMDPGLLRQLEEEVRSDAFKVLVLGEFNRGKSTFINAMLKKEVLPAYSIPTTAIINEVKWGEQPRALLCYKQSQSGVTPIPQEIPVDELIKYVTIKDAEKKLEEVQASPYEKVELFWPLELCREGVEIIDSPGLNENPARENETMGYLKTVDAVLFILSCEQLGPSISEKKTIDVVQSFEHSDVFFICNRFDQVRSKEKERIQQYAYEKFGPLTQPYGKKRIFFISAADALDGRLDGKPELEEQSGILLVEESLQDFLTRERGRVKLMRAINQLRREVTQARFEVIPMTLSGLDTDLQDLEKKYAETRKGLDELQTKRQLIISRITNARHEVWHDVNQKTERFYNEVSLKIEPWLKDYEIKNRMGFRLEWPKEQIEKVVKELSGFFDSQVQKEFATWQGETLQSSLDLRLERMAKEIEQEAANFIKQVDQLRLNLTATAYVSTSADEVEEKVSATERILSAAGGFLIGGVGAAGVGAVFGMKEMIKSLIPQIALGVGAILLGITNPWVLVPMLLGAGGVQGIFKLNAANEEIKKKMAEKFRQAIQDQKADQARKVADEVSAKLDIIQQAVDKGLNQEIKNLQNQMDTTRAEKQKGAAYVERRKVELQTCREELNRLDEDLDELVTQL